MLLVVGVVLAIYLYGEKLDSEYDPSPLPREVANAPYFQTPPDVLDIMLKEADLGKNDVIYDLGCGDGRIVVAAAERHGCKGIGFDIDPDRVSEARALAKEKGVEHLVTIEERDVFTVDLSKATVVTMYLLPAMNKKLIPQLQEMKPGCIVISHDWDIEGIQPDKIIPIMSKAIEPPQADDASKADSQERRVLVFTTPLRKVGS